MRWTCAVLLFALAGCGPFGIGFGTAEALNDENPDQSDLKLELTRMDGEPGTATAPAYTNDEEAAAANEAEKRTFVADLGKPAQVDAILFRPGDSPPEFSQAACREEFDKTPDRVFDKQTTPYQTPQSSTRHNAEIEIPLPLPDGEYRLWVRARDSVGQVDCKEYVWIVDTVPPTFSPNLVVKSAMPRQLDLSWDAALDATSEVKHYRVYWDVGGINIPDSRPDARRGVSYNYQVAASTVAQGSVSGPLCTSGNVNSFQLGGSNPALVCDSDPEVRVAIHLLSGRAHYVQVTAVDKAGNETQLTTNDSMSQTRFGGDGTFEQQAAALKKTMVTRAAFGVVGDFNRDGIPDLAAMEDSLVEDGTVVQAGETIWYMLGDGNGDFGALQSHPIGGALVALQTADMDRDGADDLVAVDLLNGVQVLLADPVTETFVEHLPAGMLSLPQDGIFTNHVHLADMDADGMPDILFAETSIAPDLDLGLLHAVYSRELGPPGYRAAFGPGETERYFSPSVVEFPRPADFDGDGIPDVVWFDNSVRLLLHETDFIRLGPGVFRPSIPFSPGAIPNNAAVHDFTGDRIPDVVVGNRDGQIRMLVGVGQNGLGDDLMLLPEITEVGGCPDRIAVGDFDDDNILDIAVLHEPGEDDQGDPLPGKPGITVLLGNGEDGKPEPDAAGKRFRFHQEIELDELAETMFARDATGDGIVDLVLTMPIKGEIHILRGKGARAKPADVLDYVVSKLPDTDSFSVAVATGDFDSDGVADTIFGVRTEFFAAAEIKLTSSRNGHGLAVGSAGDVATGFAGAVGNNGGVAFACGDFDHDGILDVAAQTTARTPVLLVDIAMPGDPPELFYAGTPELQVLFGRGADGRGNGTFQPTDEILVPNFGNAFIPPPLWCAPDPPGPEADKHKSGSSATEAVVAADFNADGLVDIATLVDLEVVDDAGTPVGAPIQSAIAVFLAVGDPNRPGRGDRSFTTPQLYLVPCRAESLVAANLNGDNVIDLAVSSFEDKAVYIFTGGTRDVGTPRENTAGIAIPLGKIGDGTFEAPVIIGSVPALSILQIIAGDFDCDGDNDLALLHPGGVQLMRYVRNTMDPAMDRFELGNNVAIADTLQPKAAAADLDNDGTLDLAVIVKTADDMGKLAIIRGSRDGTLKLQAETIDLDIVLSNPVSRDNPTRGIAFGDFNGDSIPDIVVVVKDSDPLLLLGKGTVSGN